MIDAAEFLKAHNALLAAPAQDGATAGEAAGADYVTGAPAAPTQPAPRRTMTLAAGKYYVTEDSK